MTRHPKAPARPVSPRLWGAVALTGAAVGLGAPVPAQAQDASFTLQAPETLWLAQAEGGESG